MNQVQVTADVARIDLLLYWAISLVVILVVDAYAKRKLGGKQHWGYRMLRIPKMLSLLFVSGYSILLMLVFMIAKPTVSYSVFTFFGIPYFVVWVFFLINVLRRVRAETKR